MSKTLSVFSKQMKYLKVIVAFSFLAGAMLWTGCDQQSGRAKNNKFQIRTMELPVGAWMMDGYTPRKLLEFLDGCY